MGNFVGADLFREDSVMALDFEPAVADLFLFMNLTS